MVKFNLQSKFLLLCHPFQVYVSNTKPNTPFWGKLSPKMAKVAPAGQDENSKTD